MVREVVVWYTEYGEEKILLRISSIAKRMEDIEMLCMVIAMVDSPEEKRKIEKLYEKYNRLMYTVAFKVLKHSEDAEDALMEAWEKIIVHLDKINEIDCQETKSFLVIITERTAIDLYRRKSRRGKMVIALSECEDSPFFATREKEFENIELYHVMRNIPKKYAEVLILYYIHGLTGREIAKLFGIKEDAVMKRLSRGRKMLGEEMGK